MEKLELTSADVSKSESRTFEVHGSKYLSQFHRGADGLVWFDRTHHYDEPYTQTDVFGRFWSVAVLPVGPSVSISRHGQLIEVHGTAACFIPPFSIIKWHLPQGLLKFTVYLSRDPLPAHMPKEPVWIHWAPENRPDTTAALLTVVEQSAKKIPVGKEETISAVALKTKSLIDQTFAEDLSMADAGQQLGYSHSVMTRAFKKCYGIPPIEYRNRLRVFESMSVMVLNGQGVAKTAAEVGFKDLSRFNKNFRRQIKAVPSQFRPPWKKLKRS